MWKVLRIMGISGGLCALIAGCAGLSDIRPESLKPAPSVAAKTQGQALLAEVIAAHGGLQPWEAQPRITARYRDHWQAWLPKTLFMEWEENNQLAEVTLEPARFGEARFTFLDGSNAGEVWGLEGGRPYRQASGQKRVWTTMLISGYS